MSPTPELPPACGAGRTLHQRLIALDPTAWADLAAEHLDLLIAWLTKHNRRIDPDWCRDAAEDAILALVRDPASYRPDKQTLEVYLRMSAQGDLKNILRREGRHHKERVPWKCVELSPEAGKYLGRDDDPALPLLLDEEERRLLNSVPVSVREGMTEPEMRVLMLLLRKERKHDAFAAAYGVTHLPLAEQKNEVKRVKDRLKARWKRAGGGNEWKP